jgi:hypothetical protein
MDKDSEERDPGVADTGARPNRVDVAELLKRAAAVLREDFQRLGQIPHSGSSGLSREEVLRHFLNEHLPRRFSASSGFVVDAERSVSSQTDIIIYDALNAPVYLAAFNSMILGYDTVAVTIEVKSRLRKAHIAKAIADSALIRSMTQQLRPLQSAVLKDGTWEKVLEGGGVNPMATVFAYESSLSLRSIAAEWARLYSATPFGTQPTSFVVLDRGVVQLCAWHPGIGMAERQLFPVQTLPPLRASDGKPQSRVVYPRVSKDGKKVGILTGSVTGFPPGTKFFMTYEALGESTLDWFFHSILQYLSYWVRLREPDVPHFGGPMGTLTAEPLGVCVEVESDDARTASKEAVMRRLKELLA